MSFQNCREFEENLRLRRKKLSLGICPSIGPTGPTGPQGERKDIGSVPISSNEGLLFTSFIDTTIPEKLKLQDT